MTTREFHKTLILVEVLSEEPIVHLDLQHVAREIDNGDYCGKIIMESSEKINGVLAAQLMMTHDSDPEFFELDENGNDSE